MPVNSVRSVLQGVIPTEGRKVLRALLHYSQRILRWPIILIQVRGRSARDQWVLVKSALASPVIALRDIQGWQDPVLLQDVVVTVPGIGQFELRHHTDDLWHVTPWRERAIIGFLRKSLRPGDVFVDAGANLGIYTVLASRLVGAAGRVISIEMMPDTADRLDAHIRLNMLSNVTVVRKALSNEAGQVVVATVEEGKYGQATIATDVSRYGLGKEVQVTTTTLDEVTGGVEHVRLMKIDLEGAEFAALQGAKDLLGRLQVCIFECWSSERCASELIEHMLQQSDFVVSQLDGNNYAAERRAVR